MVGLLRWGGLAVVSLPWWAMSGPVRFEDMTFPILRRSLKPRTACWFSPLRPFCLLPPLYANMSSDAELRRDAADALSHILSSHNIAHAWIGGFALQALGATRNTTDIDIEIDVPSVDDIHSRIGPMIVSADPRFSIHNLKLYFTASGSDCLTPRRVPIETLPIGSLNLPRRLQVVPDGKDYLIKAFNRFWMD